jgi:hypothetical protein
MTFAISVFLICKSTESFATIFAALSALLATAAHAAVSPPMHATEAEELLMAHANSSMGVIGI